MSRPTGQARGAQSVTSSTFQTFPIGVERAGRGQEGQERLECRHPPDPL